MDPADESSSNASRDPIQVALEWKDRGNAHYGQREFEQAAKAYQAGLDALPQHMLTTPSTRSSDMEDDDLPVALRSNLALTLIKLEEFDRAEGECSAVLETFGPHAKVYYRRAIAREGKSRKTNLSLEDQRRQYILAMDDLQQSLRMIDEQQQKTGQDDVGTMKMRKQTIAALDRMEHSYNNAADKTIQTKKRAKASPQDAPSTGTVSTAALTKNMASSESTKSLPKSTMNGKSNGDVPAATITAAAPVPSQRPPPPPTQQQKQDVMRLLLARKMTGATPTGEAFFLLDWQWWCQWCREVDFFYRADGGNDRAKVQRILELLPIGAVLPPWNDEDDDDSSSDEETGAKINHALGVIDNSRLLLDPHSTFHQQWYLPSTELAPPKVYDALRPNLVRGHHFELLPREVYNALRSWYGEVTPSICRRTNQEGRIALYESSSSTATPSKSLVRIPKCSACRALRAISRCKRCMSVQYCDRKCQEAHWPYHKALCKQATATGNKLTNNDALSGKVGLNNLGNTCFMNSALQSLSHATPLTRYFLSNKYKEDVNTSNPLGTGGKLAMTYDGLMKELWMRNKGTSYSPTALKRAVAMFAPRFAGCLQHDAQEFLAYLLDGLHEDLNRIRKAPYVEMPDVTDGQNMAVAGAEAWDAHKRRNDSLVMDTFYGQFQSTCVCPRCSRVSVSFDAYNHVSLEIPQIQKVTVSISVIVFRKPSNPISGVTNPRVPLRYGLTLKRQCLIADLKEALGELTGIPATHLVLADIYENAIYELLENNKSVSTIRPNDVTVAFEVDPYNSSSIHVIATQSLVVKDKNENEKRAHFGFPVMTSFQSNMTCRQVWDHMWEIVQHFVQEEGSEEGFVDSQNRYRPHDLLTIQVVNNQGYPVPVFSTEEGTTTAAIPFDSDEEIHNALGNDCTESFLFLAMEWSNPQEKDSNGQELGEGDAKYEDPPPVLIRPNAFVFFEDHSSLLDVIEQQRAKMNGSKAVTLDQCFETFTKPERLDENNMWYCSKCKEHVRAMKTMKLWRLPNILVVHLKRFEFKHSLRRDKLDTPVDFPLEGLDMSPHCCSLKETRGRNQENIVNSKVDAKYDLFAVVNHYGRMGFGHYTAFCRQWDEEGLSTQWHLFDDSNVRPIDSSEVSGPAAYVLFYRRRKFH